MEEKRYKIKIRRGHSDKLCYWLDPLSQEILDGDADLIEEDELSCDNKCMHRLVDPFFRQYYPGKIRWKNELNMIPMKNVRMLEKELRACIRLLKEGKLDDPRLDIVRDEFDLKLLIPAKIYSEKYEGQSDEVILRGLYEHMYILINFYRTIADYLAEMVEKDEPEGFLYVAFSAPK